MNKVVVAVVCVLIAVAVIAVVIWLIRKWLKGRRKQVAVAPVPSTAETVSNAPQTIAESTPSSPDWAPHGGRKLAPLPARQQVPPPQATQAWATPEPPAPRIIVTPPSLPGQPDTEIDLSLSESPSSTRERAGGIDWSSWKKPSRTKELALKVKSAKSYRSRLRYCEELFESVDPSLADMFLFAKDQLVADAVERTCMDMADTALGNR